MTKQVIRVPAILNDGAHRPVQEAIRRANANFTELYDRTVNVKDFGAVGDGVTDDSAAVGAAILATTAPITVSGYSNYRFTTSLFFPDGQYLVTQNNFIGANFGQDFSVYGGRLDTIFRGTGRNSAVVIFKPSVTDACCYDQTLTPGKLLAGFKIQNLGFHFDNSVSGGPIHFVRSLAAASKASQNWRLNDTKFQGVVGSRLFWLTGTVNEDVISAYDTLLITFENAVYSPNNAEAVVHSFYQLDMIDMRGSPFKYNKGGGLQVVGSSCIMEGTAGADTGVLELLGGSTQKTFKFIGIRTELRGANTRLLLMPEKSAHTITYENCETGNMPNNQAWAKVIVQHHCTINFRDCILPTPDYGVTGALGTKGTLQLTDSTSETDYSSIDGARSFINFENCANPGDRSTACEPWVDYSKLTGASANFRTCQISYRGCTNIPDMVEYGFSYRQGRSFATVAPPKLIFRGTVFPHGDGAAVVKAAGDLNTVVPLNCFVTEIVVMRKAMSVATTYRIEFIDTAERTTPGSGVVFGTTTAAANNLAIKERVSILYQFIGTRAQRTIWCRAAQGVTLLDGQTGVPTDGGIYAEVL